MRFFDLFSGIGGFRLGLERAGHECVGSCEIDKFARQIYEKRFGDKPELDVRELDASRMPKFDILTGGFPCQAFSIAGKRMGFDDTRGTLFFEIARIAKETRPSLLFLENVKGLLNHDNGRTFGTILNTLSDMGYDIEWQIINGKYFVPQNRERIFIIGHLRTERSRQVFPLGTSDSWNVKSCKETESKRRRERSTCLPATYWKGRRGTMIKVINSEYVNDRVYDPEGISPTLMTQSGGQTIPLFMLSNTKSHMNKRIQLRRESWALDTSGRHQAVQDEVGIRKLTPLECERLMGFPDGWTEGISDTQRYKCLGNAVIVPVIEEIGKALNVIEQ